MRTIIIGIIAYFGIRYLYHNGYLDKVMPAIQPVLDKVHEAMTPVLDRLHEVTTNPNSPGPDTKAGFCGCGCDGKCGCAGADGNGCSGLNGLGQHDCGPTDNLDKQLLSGGAGFRSGYGNLVKSGDPRYTAQGVVTANGLVIEPIRRTQFFKPGTIIMQSPSIGVNAMGGFRALKSSQAQETMSRW